MRNKLIALLSIVLVLSSSITSFGLTTSELNSEIDNCLNNKNSVHQIATIARQLGCQESNPIIVEASRLWWEYDALELGYRSDLEKESQYDSELNKFLSDNYSNAVAMAGTMYAESRGLDARECSMISWCILNRYDTQRYGKTLSSVIWAKSQFAHSTRTVSDSGIDLVWLAQDVLTRWYKEQQGETNVGRTLPQGYCFYYGNGHHNLFRMKNSGWGSYNFGLWNPYENL